VFGEGHGVNGRLTLAKERSKRRDASSSSSLSKWPTCEIKCETYVKHGVKFSVNQGGQTNCCGVKCGVKYGVQRW
jgi:hypothetical protein